MSINQPTTLCICELYKKNVIHVYLLTQISKLPLVKTGFSEGVSMN